MSDISWHGLHLMGLLDFTEDDLKACREGHLSMTQHFKLRKLRLKDDVVGHIRGPIHIYHDGKYDHRLLCQEIPISISLQQSHSLRDEEEYSLYYVVKDLYGSLQNILVAAEHHGVYGTDDYPDQQLRQAFEFSEEDLNANRLGTISEAQIKQLQQRNYDYLFSIFLWVGLLGFAGFVMPWVLQSSLCQIPVVIFGCLIIIALYGVASSVRARTRHLALSVIGPVKFGGTNRIVINGERSFSLDPSKVWSFIPGEVYTIYYVPHSPFFFRYFDAILAAEHHPSQPF